MALDATVGGLSANSYVTEAEASDYFSTQYGRTDWSTAASSDQDALLMSASLALDTYTAWEGYKNNLSQSMEWPRSYTYDRAGLLYDSQIIPPIIKRATFELAYYMWKNGGLSFAQQIVNKVKVSAIEVDFTNDAVQPGIPQYIRDMVGDLGRPLFIGYGGISQAPLERA